MRKCNQENADSSCANILGFFTFPPCSLFFFPFLPMPVSVPEGRRTCRDVCSGLSSVGSRGLWSGLCHSSISALAWREVRPWAGLLQPPVKCHISSISVWLLQLLHHSAVSLQGWDSKGVPRETVSDLSGEIWLLGRISRDSSWKKKKPDPRPASAEQIAPRASNHGRKECRTGSKAGENTRLRLPGGWASERPSRMEKLVGSAAAGWCGSIWGPGWMEVSWRAGGRTICQN